MARPSVTLLMTARERHGLTLACIDDILAKTPIPHRFVFAHGALPERIDAGIAERVRAGRIEARRVDGPAWPQHLRKAAVADVDTDYVAFIDNDILVSPGWIERLLECAAQTAAGAVGPVYLWGDGSKPPTIHMAGGRLQEIQLPGGSRCMLEQHRHMNEDPNAVIPTLAREACDTVEFHCMVMPTALARDPSVLDPAITCVHEHIDVALTLHARGRACVLEPAAQVTYLAHAPFTMEDIAFTRFRWESSAVDASIAAFCRKWNVRDDERSFGGVRRYASGLRTRYDPLRVDADLASLREPLDATQLAADATGLLRIAEARRYAGYDRELLKRACALASSLVDARLALRAANVLARYDFKVDVVLEGLLHEAYSSARAPTAQVSAALASLHPTVELRVRDLTRRGSQPNLPAPEAATPRDAEVAAVRAAAAIAAGAVPAERENLARLLEHLGVAGFARTLRAV